MLKFISVVAATLSFFGIGAHFYLEMLHFDGSCALSKGIRSCFIEKEHHLKAVKAYSKGMKGYSSVG